MMKVATSLIDSLKAQPALLALIIMQIALLVFIFFALSSAAKFRENMMMQVFDNTKTIQDIIQRRAVACPP
jgi:hypothetical protein